MHEVIAVVYEVIAVIHEVISVVYEVISVMHEVIAVVYEVISVMLLLHPGAHLQQLGPKSLKVCTALRGGYRHGLIAQTTSAEAIPWKAQDSS
jgi:hypothetical protein